MRKIFLVFITTLLIVISCDTEDNGNTGNTEDTDNSGEVYDTVDEEENDECTANCEGFACGDDGCGGSCGICDKENEGCMNHQCGPCSGNFPNAHEGICWSDLFGHTSGPGNTDLGDTGNTGDTGYVGDTGNTGDTVDGEESDDDERDWGATFDSAKEICSTIGGRLPTVDESRSIIINCPQTETGGECKVTNDCPDCFGDKDDGWPCNGCRESSNPNTPNTGVYSVFDDEGARWTSTLFEGKYGDKNVVLVVYRSIYLYDGNSNASMAGLREDSENEYPVRCVSN